MNCSDNDIQLNVQSHLQPCCGMRLRPNELLEVLGSSWDDNGFQVWLGLVWTCSFY